MILVATRILLSESVLGDLLFLMQKIDLALHFLVIPGMRRTNQTGSAISS